MASCRLGRLGLLLLFITMATQTAVGFKREKREWILPATKLSENVDYTKMPFIAKIRSDKDMEGRPIEYVLKGHGADKEPYNLFVVNPKTGNVRVTGILDREEISQYNLTGIAKYMDGSLAEEDIMLKIEVEDQNDNPPKFKLLQGSVSECSKIGTLIMQITADDADEKGTINAKIAYSIVKQIPQGSGSMFTIDKYTGKIHVKDHTLDRETTDFYTLIVKGVDLDGAPNGNTGTGTVEIKVTDINDNVPTLEKDEYDGSIDENAVDVVVMKIKAFDKDLENSPNWLAIFDLVTGNEEKLFTIETDPKTNEGILKLVKPVDYEKVKMLVLDLAISNVAPFINGTALSLGLELELDRPAGPVGAGTGVGVGVDSEVLVGAGAGVDVGVTVNSGVDVDVWVEAGGHSGKPGLKPEIKPDSKPGTKPGNKPGVRPDKKPASRGKSYPLKIAVNNLPEGPVFSPPLKELSMSERPDEVDVATVIGSFPALDGDTGELAENVRYAKGYDPDNWITIDEETSEIKLTKFADRETKFLVNGTYFAKILCMTKDVPPKTATGTIALKVQDSNDNCPELTSTYKKICLDDIVLLVTAFDKDVYSNGEPYKFVLIEEETQGKWEMDPVNGTSVRFSAKEILWPGFYELALEISDVKGLRCQEKQKLKVEVCTCGERGICGPKQQGSSAKLGFPAAVGLMGGLLLLMLIPLLLLSCHCGAVGNFSEMPFNAEQHLINYHTEGKGEDKEVHFPYVPLVTKRQTVGIPGNASSKTAMLSLEGFGGSVLQNHNEKFVEIDNFSGYQNNTLRTGQPVFSGNPLYYMSLPQKMHGIYEELALPEHYLHDYFSQKVSSLAGNLALPCIDSPLLYNDDVRNSPGGSLFGSSLIESDNDLEFLDDLSPKFITLAEMCSRPNGGLSKPKPEQTENENVKSVDTSTRSQGSVSTKSVSQFDQSSSQQSTVTKVTKSADNSASLSHLNNGQAILVQQQPLYYLVEDQVPGTVILVQNHPAHSMYLINEAPGCEGLVNQVDSIALDLTKQNGMYLMDGVSMVQQDIMLGSSVSKPKLVKQDTLTLL